jgi:integrase
VIAPKSRAGRRAVPIVAALRAHLAARRLRRREGAALFFGDRGRPFNRNALVARAERAWKKAGLDPIGLHECRHTFASILIAAGVNANALSTHLGHSSIQITLDRYGHLMPGNEDEAVALVDAYLARSTAPGRRRSGLHESERGYARGRARQSCDSPGPCQADEAGLRRTGQAA